MSETIYDGGLRHATVLQYRAQYDETVANYRETVLTAFQQVEDDLAALRILSIEIQQQDTAVTSAERNLKIATDRYKLGIDPYLNVITAQTTLFANQQTAVTLRVNQIVDSVQLIEALEPDVLVKGADYTVATVVGADSVLRRGGKVILAELLTGHSTTETVKRVAGTSSA